MTAHPNYPSEKFCATGKQRLVEQTAWGDIVDRSMAVIFAVLILNSLDIEFTVANT